MSQEHQGQRFPPKVHVSPAHPWLKYEDVVAIPDCSFTLICNRPSLEAALDVNIANLKVCKIEKSLPFILTFIYCSPLPVLKYNNLREQKLDVRLASLFNACKFRVLLQHRIFKTLNLDRNQRHIHSRAWDMIDHLGNQVNNIIMEWNRLVPCLMPNQALGLKHRVDLIGGGYKAHCRV